MRKASIGVSAILGAFYLLGSTAISADTAAVGRRALLVGIDNYKYVSDLHGAVNDVRLMQSTITGRYGFESEDVVILRNSEATREAILMTFREHLIAKAKPGDSVLFHFSGHGSQMHDAEKGDEIDDWDETLVAYDSRGPATYDISDDELSALLEELSSKTSNITVVLDSCHSGSATRLITSGARWVEPDLRQPQATVKRDLADFRSRAADYILISGSRPEELSNETTLGGQSHGVLTYYLAEAMRNAGPSATYKELMLSVSNNVTTRFPSQHPTLEGADSDRILFGTEQVAPRHQVLVHPAANGRVNIDGGTMVGITRGARLHVFEAMGSQPDEVPSAVISVVTAEPFSASGQIVQGAVSATSRAVVTQTSFGSFKADVWIDASGKDLAAIRQRLREFEQVREVTDQRAALLRVVRSKTAWELQSADQVVLFSSRACQ
jgi:hypothetical protein